MSGADAPFPPDQRLALAYAPRTLRPAFETLLRFDGELATAVSVASEPLLGQVRLAWWRDALADPSHAENRVPLLNELATIGRSDIILPALTAMVNGWETLLSPLPMEQETLRDYAEGRGGGLFAAAAHAAGCPESAARDSGIGWALTDFAFRCSDAETAVRSLDLARDHLADLPQLSRDLRSFALLARFARSDTRRRLEQGPAARTPWRLLDTAKVVLTGK